jgi:hypothetical protein
VRLRALKIVQPLDVTMKWDWGRFDVRSMFTDSYIRRFGLEASSRVIFAFERTLVRELRSR